MPKTQEIIERELDRISTPTEDEFLELLESEQARSKLAEIITKLLFEQRLPIESEFLRLARKHSVPLS